MSFPPDQNNPENATHKFIDPPSNIEPFVMQTYGNISSALVVLGLATQTRSLPPPVEPYDIAEDFKWFTSGELDTSSFKGKYIAIWKKQVVASGDNAIEAETLAKAYCGEDCRPAVVFIPETEDTVL